MWPGHIQRFDNDDGDGVVMMVTLMMMKVMRIYISIGFYLFLKIRSSDSLQTFVNPIYTIELNWTLLKLRLNKDGQKYEHHKASARFPVLLSNYRCQGCNCNCQILFGVTFSSLFSE